MRSAAFAFTAVMSLLATSSSWAEPPSTPPATTQTKSDTTHTPPPLPKDALDFNDEEISWWPPKEGLAHSKESGKPALLIVYAPWCPRCVESTKYFHDTELVALSKEFVMIRTNADLDDPTVEKLTPGDTYVPRMIFLNADGSVRQDVTADREDYKFFYSGDDGGELLTAKMKHVLAKLRAQ